MGKTAREAAALDSNRAAAFVKREMGSPTYSRLVSGRPFRPETLSAIILRKLKLDAERRIGPIAKAVITVPAFFDDTRRKATEDAGRIAGLEVFDIINEPTAAALSYAMLAERRRDPGSQRLDIPGGEMTAVVYDLGGGTFDVTVVRLQAKRFETLATDGEVRLGGKDWDDRIVDFLGKNFREQFGVDPTADPSRRDALNIAAEKTKILLSSLPQVALEFSYQGHALRTNVARGSVRRDDRRPAHAHARRYRSGRAQASRPDLGKDRLRAPGGRFHAHAHGQEHAHSAHRQAPQRRAGRRPGRGPGSRDPQRNSAGQSRRGALELGDDLHRELQDVTELNVNSHSLGVEAMRKDEPVNSILVPKNTQLPYAASRVFRLRTPGATTVCVTVLEGEAAESVNNIRVGECRITDLPPGLPRGSPIQVRLAYGANGRISVMALDMTHGRFVQTTIQRNDRLSNDDIRRETEFVGRLNIQ